MKVINPAEHPVPFVHRTLLSGVAPRPIALVSTVDRDGRKNLSPFSFFNAFGANPPVIVVSPSFRGRDGTPKHTFENIRDTEEFTVSAVSYAMVEQINLASAEYEREVNEFEKAGFTELPTEVVMPPGVAESPFVMECRLMEYVGTGGNPGSGNLLIGEVVRFHIRESAFEGERLDPNRLDLVARMGYNWYCRASGAALFELPKPAVNGIGVDALPEHIRGSAILTGRDLARLGGAEALPDAQAIRARWEKMRAEVFPGQTGPDQFDVELRTGNPRRALTALMKDWKSGVYAPTMIAQLLQRCAQAALDAGDLELAWECALMSDPETIAAF